MSKYCHVLQVESCKDLIRVVLRTVIVAKAKVSVLLASTSEEK